VGRCLIVANQTLGGDTLDRAVRDRLEAGVGEFFILVPTTPPAEEAVTWNLGFSLDPEAASAARRSPVDQNARRREARFEARFEAQRRARRRLEKMVETIVSAGGKASGQVGDPDPVAAVRSVLEDHRFDEVIVSTLPSGLSRWLKMDLPTRVARMSRSPVTTVEADA
jgi:hypothetical protein